MKSTVEYRENEYEYESDDGNYYLAEVEASADYWHEKGCMYLSNGDPGYPPEEEIYNVDVNVVDIKIWDYDTDEWKALPEGEQYERIKTEIECYVEKELYDDWELWDL